MKNIKGRKQKKYTSLTARRNMLIGLTGGIAGVSQIPTKWVTPIVNCIILPAHAQTSSTTTSSPTTTTTQEPVCTNSVNINARITSTGLLFAISNCQQVSFHVGTPVYVTTFYEGNPPGVLIEFSHAGSDVPREYFPGETYTDQPRIVVIDELGRHWRGNLTYTYDGIGIDVTGTMSLL